CVRDGYGSGLDFW
nr:immunoglobulin heavy chain junction region [Macaca mulatta]MOX94518.1 immunoglobulin heavy chain junction region [Macaca mulatta]MOY18090.1 immunoglobulin heavy chain junction region [Macaca mulatta]MOY18460.1 immunoglobulin heavy chain junction region [Macaca mulatta]MOY18477.1 immunoglobulin heavy chain junction region [Macaca mulatta]